MLYVALGDSITHGYNCTNESNRFSNLVYQQLKKTNKSLHFYSISKPGWKIVNLRKAVDAVPSCIWDETGYVTLLIGGNDLLRAMPALLSNESRITKYAQAFQKELVQLVQIVKRPNMMICMGTIYNPFPNSIFAEKCVGMFNDVIQKVAKRFQLQVADLHTVFQFNEKPLIDGYKKGELRDFKLFRNPIHPTDLGHAKIAQVFVQSLRTKPNVVRTNGSKARVGKAKSTSARRAKKNTLVRSSETRQKRVLGNRY